MNGPGNGNYVDDRMRVQQARADAQRSKKPRIVAECWTCGMQRYKSDLAYYRRFYPGKAKCRFTTYKFRGRFAAAQEAECRAAGHDVRPVKEG